MLALFLLACGLQTAPVQDDAARVQRLFATPKEGLTIARAVDLGPHTLPLVHEYADRMGWKLSMDHETEAQLLSSETGVCEELVVPPERVELVVGSLLVTNGFCTAFPARFEPATLVVSSTQSPGWVSRVKDPLALTESQLAQWSGHPSLCVSVDIEVPELESARIAAQLASLYTDAPLRVKHVGTGHIELVGPIAAVAPTLETLRRAAEWAEPLEAARFPGTGESKPATVPEHLRAAFPLPSAELSLEKLPPKPHVSDVLTSFSAWSGRPVVALRDARHALMRCDATGLSERVPAADVYPLVARLLASANCTLQPCPAGAPLYWFVESQQKSWLNAAAGATPWIRLDELDSVASLRASVFQTFVRLPKDDRPGSSGYERLQAEDEANPFRIRTLGDSELLTILGTPQAIAEALHTLQRMVPSATAPR